MAAALRERGIDFEELDVDGSAELEERYGRLVPVLTDAQGRELCRTRLDAGVLRLIHEGPAANPLE